MAAARRLYTPAPADPAAALTAMGIPGVLHDTIKTAATQPLDIWPENLAAVLLMNDLTTQWRVGMRRSGLDYAVLPALMDLHDIPVAGRREVFDGLRIMEIEVLIMDDERHGH